MTLLDHVRTITDATISADVASKIIGCQPASLRLAARQNPQALGFPVVVINNHVKIPRIPLLKHLGLLPEEDNNGKAQRS